MDKPNLLFISPVTPALTGNGLAMRAGMMVEALATDYHVHLLTIPVVESPWQGRIPPGVSRWCARVAVHRVGERVDPLFGLIARIKDPSEQAAALAAYPRPALCRFATSGSVREAAQAYRGIAFREVHVFRLYLAPFTEPYLQTRPTRLAICRLDLDDHESRTRRRLASLYEATGNDIAGRIERAEAEKFARLEREYLPRFDRVYVCSEEDRREIARVHACNNLAVIPNGVRIPAATPTRSGPAPFTFLFVGTLGYYPNEDAASFFCSEVLPRLRAVASGPLRVHLVGAHPTARVRALSAHPEVIVNGSVPDVAGYYRDADAVVIPLRAGGGTRIKLLEAFSRRRPVISTRIGAEGISVCHGTHLLIADTPAEFAAQCVRLMENSPLRQELAERAFGFVTAHHSFERIRELLRREHRGPGPILGNGCRGPGSVEPGEPD